MKAIKFTIILLLTAFLFNACKKDWLDKKPDISLVVPESLVDFQALLDNTQQAFNTHNCVLGEIGSDNYYTTSTSYPTLTVNTQNAYLWNLNSYQTGTAPDWQLPYGQVNYANVVLDGLNKIQVNAGNQLDYNNIKGSALFFRSFAYYDMAQIFAKAYDIANSKTDLGLPIRTTSNLISNQPRATVAETYSFIIKDLETSIPLLSLNPKYKTRPSKSAAYGLLARVYLSMADYSNAYKYADSSLQLYNKLIFYNSLNVSSSTPIPQFNDEVIFANTCQDAVFKGSANVIDSNLYASYENNDLRKTIFFKKDANGLPHLLGRYSGSASNIFDGLAVDEMLLIRSETSARLNNVANAMKDLNYLLASRWKVGTYTDKQASSGGAALNVILQERRKELCFRGLRWTDLRRLNKDPKFAINLTRILNGKTYTLLPNSNRYVYQIPPLETNFNGAIIQNPL